jgi:hypothetical protein
VISFGSEGVEEANGISESGFSDSENEVDGVEVQSAAKAAREIGIWVDGGIELAAAGTKESEETIAVLRRQSESVLDEMSDGELIS